MARRKGLPTMEQLEERAAQLANRKLALRVRAVEILRQTPGIITMAEAIERAKAELGGGR